MKTFKDIIKEATTEINQLPRRSKAFVDKHVVQKIDYPVDAEDQFTAKKLKKDKTKLASFHDDEDATVYEEVDLDEAKTDVYHQHMLKALGKTRLPKDHGYTSSIANNGDFVVRKGGEVAGRIPKGEHNLKEASMSPTDMKQREDIVKGMKKSTQDFKDRYGSKWKSVMYATATKAAMKEESEQIDELSKNTLGSYVKKAADDMAGNAYAVGARDPLKPTAGFGKSFKRQKGIAKAVDKMTKEEVEQIDEISRDLARRYIRKVADKNNTGEASPKEVMKRSPGVVLAGKKAYGIGGKARVNATEEVEQIDELSSEKKMAYGKAAFADYHKQSKAKLGKILSGNKDTSGESRKIANRLKGISTSSKTEEVDLDEQVSFKKMESGDHHIHHNGNPVGRIVKTKYMGGSGYSVRFGGNTPKHEVSDESSLSAAKESAKWHLTSNESPLKKEEVDLDEAFKAGAMKLNDGSSVTLTSESSNALNNLFNQLSSQNKSKMEQRLMSGSKGFNEILAFAKEV